jgi:hypothetical protein
MQYGSKSFCDELDSRRASLHDIGGNESHEPHVDESCDVLRERGTPELSAGDSPKIDPYSWRVFDLSQYVTVERSETAGMRNFGGTFEFPEN